MSLLPLRPLPVNDAPAGGFVIRVEMRSTSASIYVRRQDDKKTWSCKVNSIQEILAPSQQARQLDLIAVVTCLYHGVGFDSSVADAFAGGPLELTRREVAFFQPETWTDDSYRLTTRIAIHGAVAAPVAASVAPADHATHENGSVVAVPIAEIQDEDIVFGFHFSPSSASIDLIPKYMPDAKNMAECLQLLGATFPNSFLNWMSGSNKDFVRPIKDGVVVKGGALIELTLEIVHPKGPALFVASVGAVMVKPTNSCTHEHAPGSTLYHTVIQFSGVKVAPKDLIQVAVLPGSACALAGTTLSLRELSRIHDWM